MPTNAYDPLIKALEANGMTWKMQKHDQLIVSRQRGAVWPDRGNSFWLSYKDGTWYLGTWSPVGYRVPSDQDIVALCSACMMGDSAMYCVPPEIVAQFHLQKLDDPEYQRLLGG